MSGVRSTAQWQRVRLEVLRGATHCTLCHRLLDFNAPPRSAWAPSVDHIVPIALGGRAFARSNLRAVHYSCNSSRGTGMPRPRKRARQRRDPVRRADPVAWLDVGSPDALA
jgi:5-methylcytosine-specific restriction endonuclease McrA